MTVIAAGFDGGGPTKRQDDRALGQVMGQATGQRPQAPQPAQNNHHVVPTPVPTTPASQPTQPRRTLSRFTFGNPSLRLRLTSRSTTPAHSSPRRLVPAHAQRPPTQQPPTSSHVRESDDLDVPDFLK